MAPRNFKDDLRTPPPRPVPLETARNRIRKNRPVPATRSNGKLWRARHLLFLFVSFNSIKHQDQSRQGGFLSNEDHMRIFYYIHPEVAIHPYRHRHLLGKYNRRFQPGRRWEWYVIDRPNRERQDAYAEDELERFAIIANTIQEAADVLDIEVPWRYDGGSQETARKIGSGDEALGAAGNSTEDAVKQKKRGQDLMDHTSAGVEEGGEPEQDLADFGQDDGKLDEEGPGVTEAMTEPDRQIDLLSNKDTTSPRHASNPNTSIPSARFEGQANEVQPGVSTPGNSYTREDLMAFAGNLTNPPIFGQRISPVSHARPATIGNELDDMDWNVSKSIAAEQDATTQAEHEAVEGYHQHAQIMAKLRDRMDPYVRCCDIILLYTIGKRTQEIVSDQAREMSDKNTSNKSAQNYQDTGDPEFGEFRAQFRANAPLATVEARLKKAEEEIDNVNLRLQSSTDPDAKDEYGFPVIPPPKADGKVPPEDTFSSMLERVREKGDLETAYEEGMLADKVKRAREEVLVQQKREEDIKMGKTRSTQPFDQLERDIMSRPSGWKK
ncbi:hypothetical protein PRZ48_008810 [Zasmidium cellare]|uniref:Uncharacterized protein n=1 Tax=Zasmidium cellare TaxID=395010 RepID=A0ABR0EHA6_ZASCE|nr:hypothetical protein PRZ48_008810 [Zasmidium cellare]